MKKTFLSIVTFLILFATSFPAGALPPARKSASKPRSSQTVKKKQTENKRVIRETSKKIETNARELNRRLNALNTVEAEIRTLNGEIGAMKNTVATLDAGIASLSDSIQQLDDRLSSMSAKYGAAIRKMATRSRTSTSNLAFIFSAESAGQAYRRSRSLQQFSKWRKRKAEEIDTLKSQLDVRRKQLESQQEERRKSLVSLNESMGRLQDKKQQGDAMVASLRKEGKQLKTLLDKKRKEQDALDAELQRLIALEQEKAREEERKRIEKERKEKERIEKERKEKERLLAANDKQQKSKPATTQSDKKNVKNTQKSQSQPAKSSTVTKPAQEKKKPATVLDRRSGDIAIVGSDFASNKGRIPSPVVGPYKIVKRFGRQKHPELKYVETNNTGIDIEGASQAKVRAVFDGKVTDIFRLPGYNTIVMVRHGSYLTVYANLGSISIRKGDTVKAGQIIGTIYADPDDDGRSVLHFEIRHEKDKEDPEAWIA